MNMEAYVGGASVWHWIIVFGIVVPVAWAGAKILRRIGYSGWWVVLAFVWPLNVIGLCVLAWRRKWPVEATAMTEGSPSKVSPPL